MADPYDSLNLLDLNINPPSERPGNTRIPNQQNQNEQPTSTTSVSPGPWRSAPTQQNENEQSTSTTTRSPGPWRSDPLLTPTPNQQKENEPPNSTTTTSPGPWRSARVLNKQKENEPPKSGGTHYNDLDTFEQQIRTAEPPRPDPGTQVPGPYSGPPKSGPEVLSGPNLIVRDYLRAKDPTFHGCDYLRDKVR